MLKINHVWSNITTWFDTLSNMNIIGEFCCLKYEGFYIREISVFRDWKYGGDEKRIPTQLYKEIDQLFIR